MTDREPPLQHLAIIMDGNNRWAQRRGLTTDQGHRAGLTALKRTIEHCYKRNIQILSIFAFSSENWKRSQNEVDTLMQLFCETIEQYLEELIEQKIRLRFIGNRQGLPEELRELLEAAEEATENGKYYLVVALKYGGQQDITQACKKTAELAVAGKLDPNTIDVSSLNNYMELGDLPPPDLCIRTSNEHRLSNFMLWQMAYTEFHFCEVLWPDFDAEHLNNALADFASRQRRYGASSTKSQKSSA